MDVTSLEAYHWKIKKMETHLKLTNLQDLMDRLRDLGGIRRNGLLRRFGQQEM
jgi:hypothetical protein